MRYVALLLALALAACLALGLFVSAAAAQDDNSYDLTLTEITWIPETAHANEELTFAVSYARGTAGSAEPPSLVEIQLQVAPITATNGDDIATTFCSKTEDAPGALDLPAGGSNTHRFSSCFIPASGEYTVTANLLVEGQQTGDPVTAALSVGPEQTALPGEFGRLFAGLGMFAAIMVIVSLGTEVLIDSFKVLLGMKSKVTSMEAVTQMENLLPGQLASLGVSAGDQAQFRELSDSLNATLRQTLKPINELDKAKLALSQGELGTAYTALTALGTALSKTPPDPADDPDKLRAAAKTSVAEGLQTILEPLKLPAALQDELLSRVNNQIDTITPQKIDDLLQPVIATLSQPDWAAKVTNEWLKGQRDTLIQAGRDGLLARFEQDVEPVLKDLGLDPDLIAAKGQLEVALNAADAKATAATDTFLQSLENLLNGVEARRHAMQSPIRKIWRRLRTAKIGAWLIWLLAAIPAIILPMILQFFVCLRTDTFCPIQDTGWQLLSYYIISLALVGLVMFVFWWQGQRNLGAEATGHSALEVIEAYWNRLRGQPVIDPETFDKPPTLWEVLLNRRGAAGQLTAENVASIILARSDQQRDEEASRQRWLRVISVLVGLALAYLLQIDAGQLLDAAVPGVSGVINSIFNFSGERMHAYWAHFPAGLSLTAGMVLTGLAASAGSAFWHEQLGRLQATKKGAEAAANVLKQAQDVMDTQR